MLAKARNLPVVQIKRPANLNRRSGHRGVTERHQNYHVKILAAIAVIWGLSLLSLAYSLIPESARPAAGGDGASEKPDIAT